MEKESKDADTVQTAVAIRSWATLKTERTEKTPVLRDLARGQADIDIPVIIFGIDA